MFGRSLVPLAVAFASMLVPSALADTVSTTWIGGPAGAWSDPSWSGIAAFPDNSSGTEYLATIQSAAVALDAAAPALTLNGLTLGASASLIANLGARSLDLLPGAGPNPVGGTLANGGLINAAGGTLTLRNAVIDNAGTLRASLGGLVLDEVDVNGGAIDIAAGGSLTIAGLTFLNGPSVVNRGSAEVTGTVLNCCGSILNTGTFTVRSSGTLSLAGGVTNDGTFALEDAGARLVLLADTFLDGTGALALGGGTIEALSGTEQLVNQSLVSGAGQVLAPVVNLGTVAASGDLYFGKQVANSAGVLRVETGARMELFDLAQYVPGDGFGPGTLTGGTYEVAGALELDFASIAANQASIALSGPAARIGDGFGGDALAALEENGGEIALSNGAVLATAGGLSNSGAIRLADAASSLSVGGDFHQSAGGVFALSLDAILGTASGLAVNGAVTLDGLIRVLLAGEAAAGARFEWLTFTGALSGAWTYDLPALAAGLAWQEERGANYLALTVGEGGAPSDVPEPSPAMLLVVPLAALALLGLRRRTLLGRARAVPRPAAGRARLRRSAPR
ncbi:MAG: hypothetical protein IT429_15880 [Gemmataceae bacterium]|nr:hypothetical protein [Gemmataceae bacterium]